MKKIIFLLLVFGLNTITNAQPQWVNFSRTNPTSPILTLTSSNSSSVSFNLETCGMFSETIIEQGITFNRVSIANATSQNKTGSPELPSLTYLVAIP